MSWWTNIGRNRHRLPGYDYHLSSWIIAWLSPHMTWSAGRRNNEFPVLSSLEDLILRILWPSRCHVTPHPSDSQLNEIWRMTTKRMCLLNSSQNLFIAFQNINRTNTTHCEAGLAHLTTQVLVLAWAFSKYQATIFNVEQDHMLRRDQLPGL